MMDTEISKEEMLIVRGNVRHRLLKSLHEHRLHARLEHKSGKHDAARAHEAEVERIAAMIHAIDGADELDPHDVPYTDGPTHLQEA